MIKKLMPHVLMILSLVTLTLLILYQFNPGIFVTSFFQVTLLIFCIAAIITSAILIAHNKRT